MKQVHDALRRLALDLADVGAEFALVGGLAVSARTEPRFTRDVDVAIQTANDQEAEAVIHTLMRRGYLFDVITEQKRTGRMATCRLH